MILLDDPTSLSLLFHLNSEPWLNDDAYRSGSAHAECRQPAEILTEIDLPAMARSPLTELFSRRSSCREFAPRQMPLEIAASLLGAAYGIIEDAPHAASAGSRRRSVPSAGGLYPLEVYAFLRRIDRLEDGLYHYDVPAHALQQMIRGDLFAALEPVFYTYPFVQNANIIAALAAVFPRTQKKYGPRGYRYILIEAGHAGQNFCLRAAELGLSTLCMGGFVDSSLNQALGLDPAKDGVVYTLAAGYDASYAPRKQNTEPTER